MFNLRNNIIDVCNNHYKYLLNLQNVCGIGLGFKYINNINTLEPCIHVLVENKLPSNYIQSNNLIPKQYMGLKTDVIKIGKVTFLSNDKVREKFRPLEGGSSLGIAVGFQDDSVIFGRGTLGCIVTKTNKYNLKKYFILSNNHVLARLNFLPMGTSIIQPNVENGGTPHDVVATLSKFVQIKFYQEGADQKPINFVDCAIAELLEEELSSNLICKIGKLKGADKAELGDFIKKVGYVSGFTEGSVVSLNSTLDFKVDETRSNLFINQIVAKLPIETGDSGSIVLNNSNKAVGLLFAGTDDGYAYMNDINLVLNYLDVELYTD